MKSLALSCVIHLWKPLSYCLLYMNGITNDISMFVHNWFNIYIAVFAYFLSY